MGLAALFIIGIILFQKRSKDIPNERPEPIPRFEYSPSDGNRIKRIDTDEPSRANQAFDKIWADNKVKRNTKGQFTESNPYNIKKDKVTGRFLKLKP